MSDLPLRPRSTRISARTHKYNGIPAAQRAAPKPTEIFPGLNDVTDALEALPFDVIRYFTLLKEIDAKCVSLVPLLNSKIINFRKLEDKPELKDIRTKKVQEISRLIRDILPCLEEKMHVASIAADKTVAYIDRINDDFELVFKNEIPELVKFGQINHPAIINNAKIPDNKSAQSQRSESRREALAAKKAANDTENDDSRAGSAPTKGPKARKEKEGTPTAPPAPTQAKKRKPNTTATATAAITNPPIVITQVPPPPTINNSITQALKNEEINISRPSTPTGKRSRTTTKKKTEQLQQAQQFQQEDETIAEEIQKKNSNDEPLYCYCNQVSYGEMVGCDGDDCKREWFHLPCTGLATLPKGKWYCDDCNIKLKKAKRI